MKGVKIFVAEDTATLEEEIERELEMFGLSAHDVKMYFPRDVDGHIRHLIAVVITEEA